LTPNFGMQRIRWEEEKDGDLAPHTLEKRQLCCRNRSTGMLPGALVSNFQHALQALAHFSR
jgi:hypothetical protein